MIRRPPRSTLDRSSAASDVYKRQVAMHVHTGMPVGKTSFRSGKVMASADELYITIKGKGGHAASPHLCVDPILIASHLIISLQQVISRNNNPHNPSVLSITSIN